MLAGFVSHRHLFQCRAIPLDRPPTHADIDRLQDGEFYLVQGDMPYVKASREDDKLTYFTCPWCWTKYRKDGTHTVRARRVEHLHGRQGVGMCHKVAHCHKTNNGNPPVAAFEGYMICVTAQTPLV